jgi:hypothetical protein
MAMKEKEKIMNDCGRLFRADNIKASYCAAHKALVISGEVTLNPYADSVHICRNPLERLIPAPAVHEYMVIGTTRPGIHPDIVVKRTISGSFPMDGTPEKVAVYSMGIDNPERVEVPVGTAVPAVGTQSPAVESGAPQTSPVSTGVPVEATGWSTDFVLQDALTNAVAELRTAAGFRNPDVGLHFEVVAIGGQVGGFTLHTGVFVQVKAG